jgi:hypothetical protein
MARVDDDHDYEVHTVAGRRRWRSPWLAPTWLTPELPPAITRAAVVATWLGAPGFGTRCGVLSRTTPRLPV